MTNTNDPMTADEKNPRDFGLWWTFPVNEEDEQEIQALSVLVQVFEKKLSTVERPRVAAYLADRYGVTP